MIAILNRLSVFDFRGVETSGELPCYIIPLLEFLSENLFSAPIRPYMVQIFTVYGLPIDPNWATVSTFLAAISN